MFGKKGELSHSSKRVKNITTGNIYGSASECAEKESINFSHVCAVCRGDSGSTNNCVYRYIDDEGNIIQPENSASIKNRPVRNIDTDEIFNTAQEAEIYYTGKKSGNLNRVCKGQRKTFAGYRWEYV